MPLHAGSLGRWRARVRRTFYAHFFQVLIFAVSLSQWSLLWWLFPTAVGSVPVILQVCAPLPIYFLNRRLMARTRRQARDRLPAPGWMRVYYSVAFTSLFCALFLLPVGLLWVAAKVFLGGIAAYAWTGPSLGVESSVDLASRWLGNAGIAGIVLTFGYGYSFGQLRLKTVRLTLPLPSAPAAIDGTRIAHISDIHIGPNLTAAELRRFVARVNRLQPDLICITGDIADSPAADLESFLPLLAQLRARRGIFAILGNHDHYAGADHVVAALRRLTPFTVLRDERTTLDINGQPLHIIGVDDHGKEFTHRAPHVPYLDTALAMIPSDEPVLLLCHRPDIFPQAAAAGVTLTLSGHTHGGQLSLPRFRGRMRNLAEFITSFDRGLFERGGSYLYVNSGLGVTVQRIRLNAPREITLIEVRAANTTALAA